MEIARSACPNELLWQELSFIMWRFVESKNVIIALEKATVRRVRWQPPHHGIGPSDLRNTARPRVSAAWEGRGAAIRL